MIHMNNARSIISAVTLLALVGIILSIPKTSAADTEPATEPVSIPAHSHNDYYRDSPLHEALAVGIHSIEVDVFPVQDRLMVAHDRHEIRDQRTIDSLYIDPLHARLERLGSIYPAQTNDQPVILLVDFKGDWEPSLDILERELEPLRPWLTRVEQGHIVDGKLIVIVSGQSPRAHIAAQNDRLVFADGRLPDLETTGYDARVAPLVSDRWGDHFSWRGFGPISEPERRKLRAMIQRAEDRGQMLRLWASPDTPRAWAELLDAGVHLVNTDRPLDFGVWYSKRRSLTPVEVIADPTDGH